MNELVWYAKDRFLWCLSAIRIAWKQVAFKLELVIYTVGVIVALIMGIEITNVAILISVGIIGLGMEIANTSVEILLDIVHPSYSEKVKIVKDSFSVVPISIAVAYVVYWSVLMYQG